MASAQVRLSDLAREPGEVARGLAAWQRGDADEAVSATLGASAGTLHGRSVTLWVWAGALDDGTAVWVVPVRAADAAVFAPRGPATVLVRSLGAAIDAGADPKGVRFLDWMGWVALAVPGAEADLAGLALTERHPDAQRVRVARLPDGLPGDPAELDLGTPRPGTGSPLVPLAEAVDAHPVEVALTLLARGVPVEGDDVRPELVGHLRGWGLWGDPEAGGGDEVPAAPPTIDGDPCWRRRHARRVLQRLLRLGKVGGGFHTAFDHLYRGAPADQRHEALEVGEALLRAGLLGEKPSVGQRHVYLRREALPAIHALIERGVTDDPALAAFWTAPAP
ncbi:MAG: hypothetical protein U0Y82_07010 [Thermoleophilia bacterium]